MVVRDHDHLQVGVDPPRRVLLPHLPEVRRLLDDLTHRRTPRPASPTAVGALALLADHDLLVDRAQLAADLAGAASRPAVAAAYARHGDDAARRLRARRDFRVAVDGPAGVRAEAGRLLRESGCRPVGDSTPHDARLVLLDAAPTPAGVDRWLRAGLPHLVVAGGPAGGVRVGPLVVPGITACLRCVEAHLAHDDPRRTLIATQAVARAGLVPLDPALWAMATAWAVRDLVAYADGDRPATWSASLDLTPGGLPEQRPWSRHPHCGCAWDELRSA